MKMISFMANGDKFVNVYVDNGNRTSKETDIHNDHGEVTKEAIEVEDNDYIHAESSDTEDGLDDDELVSDDEEYIEVRKNMKNFKVVIDDGKRNKCNEIVHIDTHGADGEIMSEYEESDGNINSESNEDEDGVVRRFKLQNVTYDPKCDHKSLKIVLGMRFQDGFHVVKSDGHFVIKTVGGPHTCLRVMNNKLATANWVAIELLEIFRTKPDIKIKELATHIMNRYGCDVSVPKLYRARLKAQENLRDGLGYTFISDQQKGLTNALIELAPHDEHRNCARHVYCNWKKQFKGPTLKNLFWRATRSTYVAAYKKALEDMKVENKEAYLNFIERDPSKFCKNLQNGYESVIEKDVEELRICIFLVLDKTVELEKDVEEFDPNISIFLVLVEGSR
ncbi:hypothetical protein C2S51_011660 [Perilla frutescens var. frutescens]|nr:hypothetical protein C2S51_011660 [Perilla frutescens var. frutescens]